MNRTTDICGWGNYPKEQGQLVAPYSRSAMAIGVRANGSIIARGMGRSYGDSANASKVISTVYWDHFIEFDDATGELTAEAGLTLREILEVIVPKGWFLPVVPGTSYVTLGGAVASDVHGKNHHIAGTFGEHVKSLQMVLGSGELVTASARENDDLFYATCGGMGLTGVILTVTVQLIPISSAFIRQTTLKVGCIEEACEAFEANADSTYSVAWIDCLSKGKRLGRSVLMLGEHEDYGGFGFETKPPLSVPVNTPSLLLNGASMKAFNQAYWLKARPKHDQKIPMMPYFFPLDALKNWNKLYGKAGFLQFQCVLPKAHSVAALKTLLREISDSGEGSFLAVLKQFGKANENLLSFPADGFTLAVDFKLSATAIKTLRKLEDTVVAVGGKLYLTKDATMTEQSFKATYPNWEKFEAVRERYGAIGKFRSSQSIRLGLA